MAGLLLLAARTPAKAQGKPDSEKTLDIVHDAVQQIESFRRGAVYELLTKALGNQEAEAKAYALSRELEQKQEKLQLWEQLEWVPTVGRDETGPTTTFRGHTLGEIWQMFVRTESGLCRLSEANAQTCTRVAAGGSGLLIQESEKNDGSAYFRFRDGRFVCAWVLMEGPKFAELTYLERTYGKPFFKTSGPKEGRAESIWYFSDGGRVDATEYPDKDKFAIHISISAKD